MPKVEQDSVSFLGGYIGLRLRITRGRRPILKKRFITGTGKYGIRRDLTVRGRCKGGVKIEIKEGVPASKIGSYGVDSLKSKGF